MPPASRFVSAGSWIVISLLLVLSAILFMRGMRGVADVAAPLSSGSVAVGSQLPDVALAGIDGRATHLRAFVGHPLWLNFFATWCTPCKAELPEIEQRYLSHRNTGLVVLGLDQQESAIAVSSFASHYGVTYPIAIDDGPAALAFEARTIPLSVFVDPDGIVRSIRIGQMQPEAMDGALREILPYR